MTITIVAVIALVLVSIFAIYRKYFSLSMLTPRQSPTLFFACGNTLLVVTAYLLYISPAHAMNASYLAIAWPYFAITFGRIVGAGRPLAVPVFAGVWLVCVSLWWTGVETSKLRPEQEVTRIASDAATVIIDNPRRGVALRQLMMIRPGTQILVADQVELFDICAHQEAIAVDRMLLLSNTSYSTTAAGRTALFEVCAEHWVISGPLARSRSGDVYEFVRKLD